MDPNEEVTMLVDGEALARSSRSLISPASSTSRLKVFISSSFMCGGSGSSPVAIVRRYPKG
eukprot:839070-Prymnesium_polylepis.1